MEVKQLIPVALHGVQDPTLLKRESAAKWSEVTILDKTLPMHQYLEEAILLFSKDSYWQRDGSGSEGCCKVQ